MVDVPHSDCERVVTSLLKFLEHYFDVYRILVTGDQHQTLIQESGSRKEIQKKRRRRNGSVSWSENEAESQLPVTFGVRRMEVVALTHPPHILAPR